MILGYKKSRLRAVQRRNGDVARQHNLVLTLDEGEADDRYQIGRVTDRLADMTLSDIDTMQAIVVTANNDYLTVKMLPQKGSSRSKSAD